MCRNHEHPSTTHGESSTPNDETTSLSMAHGALVAGMLSKSESNSRTAAAAAAASSAGSPASSPAAAATGHNSAKMGSRRIFTPQFKLQVLDSYRNDGDCKGNQRATARKYGIHRRQIQKWLQVENNLRSVVANGGGGSASGGASQGAGSSSSSSAVASGMHSASGGGPASMKMNLLGHHHPHHHHHLHHQHLPHHHPHHHLHYQQHQQQHHVPSFHHPALTGLMAPSAAAAAAAATAAAAAAAAAAGLPSHYHHHMQHQQQQQHPLAAFHPLVPQPPSSSSATLNSIELKVAGGGGGAGGLVDSARHRVARNGASGCIMSPVLTHTSGAITTAAAIPVSSCSPLSIASSSGASLSSSSSSPSSLAAVRSPSASLSSQHQQHQQLHLTDHPDVPAPSGGDPVNRSAHQPVIFSPVPRLATAAGDYHHNSYYGHIRAVAAAVAAHQQQRYEHPIDLSRPHSAALLSPDQHHGAQLDHSIASDHDEDEEEVDDEEEEEISVDEPAAEEVSSVEQAWDLSCRRRAAAAAADGGCSSSDRKRSSSEMSGVAAAPETSRPPKSVKLFKPYLLDGDQEEEEKIEVKREEAEQQQQQQQKGDSFVGKCRRDSALADEDKDFSSRESPAISDRLVSPPAVSGGKYHPIVWSSNSNNNHNSSSSSSSYYEHFYEFSPPTAATATTTVTAASVAMHHPLMAPQLLLGSSVPAGATAAGRGWTSPQASPVSGYDSSTSISSVCSGPEAEEDAGAGRQPEQLKQQAIDSFYHDVACRGDYRAVASKYNINRKYVEKWLQQKQEDDHHNHHQHHQHQHHHRALVRGAPLIVG